jgi:hypothetical protein
MPAAVLRALAGREGQLVQAIQVSGSGVAAHDQPGRPMLEMAGERCSYGEGRLRTLGSSGRPAGLRRQRRPGVAQHIALPSPKFAAVTLRNCPAAAAHTATAAGQLRPQPGSRQPDSDVAGTHDDSPRLYVAWGQKTPMNTRGPFPMFVRVPLRGTE